ncbi:restriction endonuclease subunit S [Sulfuricurvum sp.]|uniref:restriction endonuclease subunit S n=1 Tax=Sulfuricurvum sp. TaxID=2025608 RepID=UPI00263063D4|nr:restriction endonuclease subunit S [Sulfuricurvum sp.]MDD4948844.1 restriction endonuclease subunit S [Sulfuricurvum sp.]
MAKKENSLPKGWKNVRLGDFVHSAKGKKPKNHSKELTQLCKIPYIDIDAFDRNNINSYTDGIGCVECKDTDFLMVWDGSRSGYVGKGMNGALGSTLVRLDFKDVFDKYAYYFLQSKYQLLNTRAKGSGTPHVDPHLLWNFELLIPPLEIQHRIVEKIEILFSELDNSIRNLKAAKAQLKRYRQSVLKSAFEGKLTAAWREANADKLETVGTLMERIKAERETAYASKSRKPKEILPLTADEIAGLPELPKGWKWTRIANAGLVQLGRQRSPKDHFGDHMRPYLRVANVFENRINIDDVLEMNFTPEEFKTYKLEYGDILLNEGQSLELIGRPAMFKNEMENVCFQNTLVRFKSYVGIESKYCLYLFLHYFHHQQFQKIASWTTSIAHLGAGRFAQLGFPLSSTEEQHQIVNEIESRLSEADVMERTIDESLIKAEKMRQSILKKAFEGKLVLQDKPVVESTIQVKQLSSTDLHAGIIALTMKLHEGTPHQNKLNHVKCEKIAHLCEALVGIELGRTPVQDAAGPDDYPHLKKVEHRANMVGWFHVCEESIGHTYEKGRNFNALVESVRISLGLKLAEVEKLLQIILPMDLVRAEIFATTYAAWNNLLMDGKQPDHNEIVQSAREEWSSRKMNIDRERFYKAIEWMTKVGIVPMGQGKYVKPMKVKK